MHARLVAQVPHFVSSSCCTHAGATLCNWWSVAVLPPVLRLGHLELVRNTPGADCAGRLPSGGPPQREAHRSVARRLPYCCIDVAVLCPCGLTGGIAQGAHLMGLAASCCGYTLGTRPVQHSLAHHLSCRPCSFAATLESAQASSPAALRASTTGGSKCRHLSCPCAFSGLLQHRLCPRAPTEPPPVGV